MSSIRLSTTKDDIWLIRASEPYVFREEKTLRSIPNTPAIREFIRNFDRDRYPALVDHSHDDCECDACLNNPGGF